MSTVGRPPFAIGGMAELGDGAPTSQPAVAGRSPLGTYLISSQKIPATATKPKVKISVRT